MYTDFSKILSQLDLSKEQIEVYELIFQNRFIKISELCTKLGHNRMSIYRTLGVLEGKGLLQPETDRKTNGFKLANPSLISTLLKQKQLELNKAVYTFDEYLPDILTKWHYYKEPVFKTYDGKDKFHLLFDHILEIAPEKSTLYEIGLGQDFYRLVDLDYMEQVWRPKRMKKQIFSRILPRKDNHYFATVPNKQEFLRDWKYLPEKFESIGSFWAINDTLILWDTFEAKAFEIKNHTASELLKGLFEIIWDMC